MGETAEKAPVASAGPGDVGRSWLPAYPNVAAKPTRSSCLIRTGTVVLAVGAVLMLLGTIGAFYLWKAEDKQVYNVQYSVNVNGKTEEGSMEIDSRNNLERFRTGSGDREAVEVVDFHAGVTGIRFTGGDKCYIKAQVKATLPDVGTLHKESMMFDLEEEVSPVKLDEDSLIWVSSEEPLKDTSSLGPAVLELCGDLPIFWLHPVNPEEVVRKKRDVERRRRQYDVRALEEGYLSRPVLNVNSERTAEEEEGRERGSASAFNPDNPYHQEGGEVSEMIFDPMLDHRGICCTQCHRSHTHCQRICEPLGGYWPWPYNFHGCRVACRVILPCRWWVGRMLGIL
ncbi:leukocyte cell-derived chemotaxin 1 [Chanos chanos]|uniref:Leukocyte cell-derived chemotaxin 1 n=1 Tax=Chanos chanos TaxID=29144 RepID=A0A6J2WIA6_CHACN|nr:leukocyte cell-derived chemotaxin 1-like [Chanos chanos]